MFNNLKQLLSDSIAFSIATVGNKLFSLVIRVFFFYPYLPELSQHGIFSAANSMTLLITYLCILGTDVALAYYYFERTEETERRAYFSVAVLYSTGVCFLFLILFTIFSEPIAYYYFKAEGSSLLIVLALMSTLEGVFIQQVLAFARFRRNIWTFNIMSMFYWIGSSLLSVIFLSMGRGIVGVFTGQVVAGAITGIVLLIIFRKQFTLKYKREHFLNLIRYGIPIVPSLISFWVISSVSGPLILQLVTPDDAGIYGTAVNIASFIALITSAFQLAWRPFVMSIKDREDAPKVVSAVCRLLLIIGTLVIMVISFFMKDIVLFITKKAVFLDASPIVWFFSLGALLNTLYIIMSTGLLVTKKISYMSKPFILAMVLYLVGSIPLILLFSYWGTAIMTVATYLFVVCNVYLNSQRFYPIPYKMRSIICYIGIYLILMSGITYVQVKHFTHIWLYYVIGFILMISAIFLTRLFRLTSLRPIYQFIYQKLIKS